MKLVGISTEGLTGGSSSGPFDPKLNALNHSTTDPYEVGNHSYCYNCLPGYQIGYYYIIQYVIMWFQLRYERYKSHFLFNKRIIKNKYYYYYNNMELKE